MACRFYVSLWDVFSDTWLAGFVSLCGMSLVTRGLKVLCLSIGCLYRHVACRFYVSLWDVFSDTWLEGFVSLCGMYLVTRGLQVLCLSVGCLY